MFTFYITALSILTFGVWGLDKFRAVAKGWRIPERWLFGLTILGGAFGALAGMAVFRHKTRKPLFWFVAGGMSLIYTLALVWIK